MPLPYATVLLVALHITITQCISAVALARCKVHAKHNDHPLWHHL